MLNKSYAYAETLEVLQNMDEKYVKQIPIKFMYMLKKDAQKNYKNHLNRKY
jgi:hypothetical protein